MLKSALTAIPTVFVLLYAHVTAQSLDSTANQKTPAGLVGNYRGGACDFDEFTRAVLEVQKRRQSRLVTADQFAKIASEPGTVILDARSELSYELLHVKNSKNLPYTNMSAQTLRELIPRESTKILIYCRNNIAEGVFDRIHDQALRRYITPKAPAAGLNLPIAVTLFIYGYDNVWELDEIVDPDKCPISFEWTTKGKEIADSLGNPVTKK